MSGQLDGLKVLVTGAGGGIGAAVALGMAEAGADVCVADIDMARAEAVSSDARKHGVNAYPMQADCGDIGEIDTMIESAVAHMGRMDVIVNNAGVTRNAYIMDIDEADWDRMHRVNSKGVFFAMQRAARQMIEQGGGRIINMASIAGRGFSGTSNAAYAGSKGAVLAMTYVAAHQLGPKNINVNAICPGVTFTDLVSKLIEDRAAEQGRTVDEMREMFERPIPIRRGNEPSDIAALAVFLASPGARNITGQGYNVDGGLINS
jgi:NAD(P)-dependent dehydrogenase (short-subunit alcohol dehydrogenase family)